MAAMTFAVGITAAAAIAQDNAQPVGDPVVARVDGKEIKKSDILRDLQNMGPQAQQLPAQMLYPQLLQKAIITKIVSEKGYAMKMQNEKEAKDRLKDAEAQIVADLYVRRTIQPKITEEKIKAKYDELAKKFKPEDEVRARHILVPTEEEAKDIISKVKSGTDFGKLASEKSKDSGSAKQGGDLGYFTRAVMVKPFSDAAFSMKVGEIGDKPIKTDFGYHVIKVEDKRKSSPPPLAEVKEQISSQIGQEMVAQLVKDLEAKAKIEKFNLDGTPMKAETKEKK
jgi:peptidyl-prolyl cis-trans isomerase C